MLGEVEAVRQGLKFSRQTFNRGQGFYMGRSLTQTGPSGNAPAFMADFRSRDHLIPAPAKLDAAQFVGGNGTRVTVDAAGAAAGAVAVPVLPALEAAIPAGTILDFGAKKFARLSAAAAAGALALVVDALPTALVAGDTAVYAGTQGKYIPAGTAVGRTIVERDAGTAYGPAAAADDEVFLTAFDVSDASDINDVELVRPNATIYENRLPATSIAIAGVVTKLRAAYRMIRASE